MSAAAISGIPTFKVFPCMPSRLKYLKPISSQAFPTSKSLVLRPKTMIELNRPAAFRTSDDGDEGIGGVIEESSLLSNEYSSAFRPDLMASGLESTLNRLSKWIVATLFGAVILWRHDAAALWAAMGSVINAVLSGALKRILNQERPFSTSRSDPGMPSSHAQSIFFTVMFTILSLVEWLGINEITVTIGVLSLALGSYLSWLRVSQQLHTTSQVVVGAVLGSIFSIFWFWLWDVIVLKAFVSSLWVRIVVVLGGVGVCLGFLLYVIRYWFINELL